MKINTVVAMFKQLLQDLKNVPKWARKHYLISLGLLYVWLLLIIISYFQLIGGLFIYPPIEFICLVLALFGISEHFPSKKSGILVKILIIMCLFLALCYITVVFINFAGNFPLVIYIMLILIILGSIQYYLSKNSRIFVIVLITVCLISSQRILNDRINAWEENISIKEAGIIITAIDKYYIDNKKYPEKLESLLHNYIANIPKTKMGWSDGNYYYFTEKYKYPPHKLYYKLQFRLSKWEASIYYSDKKRWFTIQIES